MILGFTGTRRAVPVQQQETLASLLGRLSAESNRLHHGCCTSADRLCHKLGRAHFCYDLWPSNAEQWSWANDNFDSSRDVIHKVHPPLFRNNAIVEIAAILIAVPAGPEVIRSGTWATVRASRKKKDQTRYIVWPDGTVGVEG